MATIAEAQASASFIDTADNAVNKTVTLGTAVTLGNLLVLTLGTQGHAADSCTVSDNLGNVWSAAQAPTYFDPHGVAFFTAKVTIAGSCTVTVNKGGAITDIACRLREIVNWDGTTVLDGTPVTLTGAGTNAGLTMNATSVANDMLITVISGDPASAFTPGSPASGFTADTTLNNAAVFEQHASAKRVPGATGAFAAGYPSMTNAGANKWAAIAFAIKGSVPVSAALAGAAADTSTATGALTAISGPNIAGAAATSSTAVAALTNWATVTLAAPLYTGVGGILDPNFWRDSVPGVGTVVYYDPAHITIQPNAEIVSNSNNCAAVVQFNDGTNWALGLVVITPLMVGYAADTSVATGSLVAAGALMASAATLVSAAGALDTAIQLAGNASAVSSATAALTAAIRLAGAAIGAATASGALSGGSSLAGSASDSTAAAGSLLTAIRLTAASVDVITAAGDLAAQIQLAANTLNSSSATGKLANDTHLASAAVTASAASASLLAQVRLASAATDLVSAGGNLTALIQLLSPAADSSSATGSLTTIGPISGAASSVTTAISSLTSMIQMSGMAWTSAAAQGALSTSIQLSADVIAAAMAQGSLTSVPFVTPPNSWADIRMIRALQEGANGQQVGDLPYGEFFQGIGERLWYGINWTEWLANRWQQDTAVTVGQSIRPTVANGYQNTCITAGRSGPAEPSWLPYVGANMRDGSALWATVPVDDTSLGATVMTALWTVNNQVNLSTGGNRDQVALVLVDTTNAISGVDYDVQCSATMSDGQCNVGKIRVKVR